MEYDLIDRRRHPHPLFFEREGKCDGVCCRCCLPLSHKASFRCSESNCNFQIHQSCIHFPDKIHSHFHPQHPLSFMYYSNCQACGQRSTSNEGYTCDECEFQIDINCAIANIRLCETSNGKYLHISHSQHPLTLALSQSPPQQNREEGIMKLPPYYCFVCELPIQSGSSTTYYFCSQCDDHDVHFHKQCAELPIQHKIPDHPHPFSLSNTSGQCVILCHVCRNKCKGFIYSCFECHLNLHIPCLQFYSHKHNFTKLQVIIEFTCSVCGEKSEDRFVFCNLCHILVHEKCEKFPLMLRVYDHHHDLTYFNYYFWRDDVRNCKICGKDINYLYAGYGCSECKYFSHLKCAQGRCVEPQSTAVVAAEKERIEQHFNMIHPHHKLTVFDPKDIDNVEYKVCDGCMKCLSDSDPSYGCGQCDFFLHQECSELPIKIHSLIHPPHSLTLISIPTFLFQCEACLQHFHGFAYQCNTCLFIFDTRCASIKTPFLHPNHQHPLFLYQLGFFDDDACDACGEKIVSKNNLEFRCAVPYCEFHLDIRCATLPVKVRYRFDQHPVYLTFFEEEEGKEKYYCDICEEEREEGVWFYSCRKCSFEAHQRCALGEFPFVKSAVHKSHKHPLNLVSKGNEENGKGCGACNIKCSSHDFAFECGACKFDVHATGPCYDLQLLEGNLVFTNYNVFSRANQPYDQSVQNFTVKQCGPYASSPEEKWGEWKGKAWKERFFSSITAFAVYVTGTGWITSIQFQYPKNGQLVWSSKHGKEEGTKTEVSFDYPDEYLDQISGSYSNRAPLQSLSIISNKKTYGPFGHDGNIAFSVGKKRENTLGIFGTEKRDKIIGIFGTIDELNALESIGFQYISTHE